MTALHPAYVSGFFDGECCIILSKAGAEVRISQNDLRPLLPIKDAYGGRITKEKGRTVYTWRLCNWNGVVAFLREIEPWLIVKREQATLLLSHYDHCKKVYGRAFNALKRLDFSTEERALRNRLKTDLHAMKNLYRNTPVAGVRVVV